MRQVCVLMPSICLLFLHVGFAWQDQNPMSRDIGSGILMRMAVVTRRHPATSGDTSACGYGLARGQRVCCVKISAGDNEDALLG